MPRKTTAKELVRRYGISAKDAKYRETGEWYHPLRQFPGVLFDRYGFVVFGTYEDYRDCEQLRHGHDLHVVPNIGEIDGYRQFEEFVIDSLAVGQSLPERYSRSISTPKRDSKSVLRLKRLYQCTCQLCRISLTVGSDIPYAEVHHIRPIGSPHNGADDPTNMLCVCPNCHARLDYFSMPIKRDSLKLLLHVIDDDNLEYYNRRANA